MKFCKDCIYLKFGVFAIMEKTANICQHPKKDVDLVSGKTCVSRILTPQRMRSQHNKCGTEGLLYEST